MTPKSLQSMAAPLVVSFTLRFLFTFVDLAYAALLREGDNASVAAIGFYMPIQALYIAVWVGLSAGFTASLSNAFGHRDEGRIRTLKAAMIRVLAVLIPLLATAGLGIWALVPHLGLEPALASAFRTYATTLTIGMALTGFWAMYPDSIVKAHQDTRSTMVAGLASSFTNVALNTWFVFGLGLGIFGIALATVLSRLAGLGYALWRSHRLETERRQQDWPMLDRTWPPPARTILSLSVPGSLSFLLASLEGLVINKVLAGQPDPTATIASWGVYNQMLQLALMPAAATAVAVVPYAARLLPLGEVARIRRELKRTLLGVAGLSVLMSTCMGWLFAAPLARFFVHHDHAGAGASAHGSAAVSPLTLDTLHLLPLGALAAVPFFILRPVFEAAQRPGLGIRVSVARFVLLSLPLLWIGSLLAPRWGFAGLHGMVAGLVLATATASVATAALASTVLRPRASPAGEA